MTLEERADALSSSLCDYMRQRAGDSDGGPLQMVTDWLCLRLAELGLPRPGPVDPLAGVARWRLLELGSSFDPTAPMPAEDLRFYQPNGELSVHRPAGPWAGLKRIAELLAREVLALYFGEALLDLSPGLSFLEYAKAAGFNGAAASGAPFAVVTAFGYWEKHYASDTGPLMDALAKRLERGAIGVFKIQTTGPGDVPVSLHRDAGLGTTVTLENGWMLASGLLTLQSWDWWVRRFEAHGFELRGDFHQAFQVLRCEDADLCRCEDWGPGNMIFVEKT